MTIHLYPLHGVFGLYIFSDKVLRPPPPPPHACIYKLPYALRNVAKSRVAVSSRLGTRPASPLPPSLPPSLPPLSPPATGLPSVGKNRQ